MARTRKGSAVKKGLKFFIYGAEGTWKSSFCLDFLKMKNEDGEPLRVAYIDTEGGSVDNYLEDLENEGIDLDNLFLIYTSSYHETLEWVDKLIQKETLYLQDDDGDETDEVVLDGNGNPFIADVIIVDSATVIQDTQKYGKLKTSEIRAKLRAKAKEASATEQFVAEATAGMEFKDYDKLNQEGKNFLQNLITKTDQYICVTSREKMKKKVEKNDKGEMVSVDVGIIPDCFKGAEYEFYTVLRTFEDDDGEIRAKVMRKDRTKVFAQNEIIDSPTPLYWQSVIDGNKGKKDAVKFRDYNETVDEDFNKENKAYKNVLEEASQEKQKEVEAEKKASPAETIYDSLTKLRASMTPNQKKEMTQAFRDKGLPTRPTKTTEESILKQMYDVAISIE
jgi:hypothetical protein